MMMVKLWYSCFLMEVKALAGIWAHSSPMMSGHALDNGDLETPALQTRQGALIRIRWLAVGGQLVTIIVVQNAIGELPLWPVLGTVAASAALNALLTIGNFARRIDENSAALHLAFDTVQLATLLWLTGGLSNPFALFLLAPVTVGAAILTVRKLAMLVGLAVAALSVIGIWSWRLPLAHETNDLYLIGTWLAMLLGVVFVAFFTWSMAEEARNTASAYSEARVALAQEERMAEVGALAAAVAHEVNTPLATVCLVANEIADQLPKDNPLQSDLQLLIGQANRCRDTLSKMTSRKERDNVVEQERIPLPSLVEMAAQLHSDHSNIPVYFDHHAEAEGSDMPAPWVDRKLEILHGLSNFIHNALQFAASRVEIDTSWNQTSYSVRIADDGPGFPSNILPKLGEPYVSGRHEGADAHLGLGIFIAKSLLSRTKAEVLIRNLEEGGAEVLIVWKRPKQT
jgi:two-component system sensor histidine kinase RegB